jgi:imidazolonepropionase-like amidohydrolase
MALNRMFPRSSLTLLCVLAPVTCVFGATDVWVSHVASEGGWKTNLSIYYTGSEPSVSFTLARLDEAGNYLEDPFVFTAINNTWFSLPKSTLAYRGSARLRSDSNLLAKVSYRHGESPSVCEFYLTGDTGQEWILPNSIRPWFDWTGIALMNSSDAPATVILEAWNQGARVAVQSAMLAARSRYVKTSDAIWDRMSAGRFDTVVIRASVPIAAPISITGNFAQDRHVFFTAQLRPQNERPLYLINGTLIDGTGREPVSDAVVVIRNGRIVEVGKRAGITIPDQAETLDAAGGFILPGFINTHVHNAYTQANLRIWAKSGVTTVRDVGAYDPPSIAFSFRDSVRPDPSCARLVAAGPLVTVPGGYPIAWRNFPALLVTSPEDARARITELLDQGAEVIKIVVEDGLNQGIPTGGWPTLSGAEVKAIVETAHARGIPVTAHITFAKYLRVALDAGLDDCGHSIFDPLSDAEIGQMVQSRVALVPTLTAQGKGGYSVSNLRRFVEAGGVVSMGNDGGYMAGLEVGMPISELEAMRDAGMTPMQVIVASTKDAAEVCRLGRILGTVEFGKEADILVVRANPLENLRGLLEVELVIHGGAVIR